MELPNKSIIYKLGINPQLDIQIYSDVNNYKCL